MTPLERWQAQVRAARADRAENEEKFWEHFASWYDNWVRHNDYVSLVFPRLATYVSKSSRVLEIGPGSGAFTVPLARAVKQLVALEPSASMRQVLTNKLDEEWLTNVRILPHKVEEGLAELDGEFDLAFASHSLYNVEPIDVVMRELVRVARRIVILMGTGSEVAWQRAVYLQLRGKSRVLPPSFREFYPVLMEMGIYADVEILPTSYNYVYDNEDALLDDWQRRLQLDASRRAELRAALAPYIEPRGNTFGIYSVNRSALVIIERDRHLFASTGTD
ncbi:MAG: class I SAM-dependent methyltransferase [Anaerolineae bacterium]|nr:class I SAM-dependent methyltransferase [Anaerolineae bacterium]